jgi:hypothetical protein
MVPAYTDFKLHDITDPKDSYAESLDMNWPVWAEKFRGGNRKFLTKSYGEARMSLRISIMAYSLR